jgi:predicted RNA-binding Zn ribbon-like protein
MDRAELVTGSVQSGGRVPADGALRLVQDFVNTLDREHGVELFDREEGLRDWLAHRQLPGADAAFGDRDLERALALREALRALLLANNSGPAPGRGASAELEEAGRAAWLAPVFGPSGAALEPQAEGLAGALGHIVAAALVAMLDGSWERLKACPRDVCGWAFYDRSPANQGTWCSMRICGNRVKANAYYRRRSRGTGDSERS